MRFFTLFSALAAVASAHSNTHRNLHRKAEQPLDVDLTMVGNSLLKVDITNNGKEAFKVFKTGTLLEDESVTENLAVYKADNARARTQIKFNGVHLYINMHALQDSEFKVIEVGETVTTRMDIASIFDLREGGAYDIKPIGELLYAEADSNELRGYVQVPHRVLHAQINGTQAHESREAHLNKRVNLLNNECSGDQISTLKNIVSTVKSRAANAKNVAEKGSSELMEMFFKDSSSYARNTVAKVYGRVYDEAHIRENSDDATWSCADPTGFCTGSVVAYTSTGDSAMHNCPGFFDMNIGWTKPSECSDMLDQPGVMMHEMTHLTEIKGTSDYTGTKGLTGYGYDTISQLSEEDNLNHADTYAFYGLASQIGCNMETGGVINIDLPPILGGGDDSDSDPPTPTTGSPATTTAEIPVVTVTVHATAAPKAEEPKAEAPANTGSGNAPQGSQEEQGSVPTGGNSSPPQFNSLDSFLAWIKKKLNQNGGSSFSSSWSWGSS